MQQPTVSGIVDAAAANTIAGQLFQRLARGVVCGSVEHRLRCVSPGYPQ
jgi:hypothetical protein